MIFCVGASSRDGRSNGRIPICIEYSATRAARCAERTEANVAIARMSVPPAVASDATVAQSVIRGIYRARQGTGCLAMLARILTP